MFNEIAVCFEQMLIYIPLVMGSFITISYMKIPDLSLESAFTAGAIVAYHLLSFSLYIRSEGLLLLVLIAAFLGGACVGFVSSFLTSYCRFPHLLSTIITTGLFHGLNLLVLGSCNVSFLACQNPFTSFYASEQTIIVCIIVLLYVLFKILIQSQLGVSFSIYGRNKHFFQRHGISERYVFMMGVIIGNGLIGISGFLSAYTQGFVDTNMAIGIALLALTTLILAKVLVSLKQVVFTPLIGSLSYFTIQQILLHVGFDLKFFTTVQAMLIVIILIIHYRSASTQSIDHLGV